ncbi:MAG: DUF748 domain-containing protein [Betaproteobacteria bacterium]
MATPTRRWTFIIGGTLIALLITGFAAFQYAIHALKGQVESALGPQGEVQEIRVSLTSVEIIGIRIKAPAPESGKSATWPAADQLRADRILIVPSLFDLLTARVALQTIRIEGAYISMLRTKDGQMKILPGLLEAHKKAASDKNQQGTQKALPISIGTIELVNGIIEFYDASVKTPAHKLRIEQINAGVDKVNLPGLDGFSTINLTGVLKGVQQDGKITISGTVEFASKELGIATRLRGVDLIALQPYLIKASESGVKKGSLDLDLNASVQKGKLRAPGTLTLKNLELSSSSGMIMGMPRSAAVGAMKNRDGNIPVKFVLEGDINDPRFSLNENLTTRIGVSLAKSLGVSIEHLAIGIGSVGSGSVKSIGESLGSLIKK